MNRLGLGLLSIVIAAGVVFVVIRPWPHRCGADMVDSTYDAVT